MITSPINLSLSDWADQLCLDLGHYGVIGSLVGEDWQAWGAQLLNAVAVNGLPSPYAFSNWRDWAFRVAEVLS